MLTFSTLLICLFLIFLTGWTVTTYLVRENSQKLIREELVNLFDISKKFVVSLLNLIGILSSYSLSNNFIEANATEENDLGQDEQIRRPAEPIQKINSKSFELAHEDEEEGNDTALSSFSPQVVEVINEEEEKVA
tara:strand:- start:276 stop:680 length:405 start_codon:yes stop_codon:yes gene_type:complete